MSATLTTMVTLIATIVDLVLPQLAADKTVKVVDNILSVLEKIIPDLVSTAQDLVTPVKNIIAALKGADGITPTQWTALEDYEKQIDDAFDAAAKDENL